MGEVVTLKTQTTLDLPSELLLQKAMDAEITDAIIIGRAKEGDLYFAASNADGGTVLWLLEQAKRTLFANAQ